MLVLSIGRPIGGSGGHRSAGPSRVWAVTTWLSVGPYWLTRRQWGWRVKKERTASVTLSCSPAVMISRRAGRVRLV
jgi:hypothetical protein